MGSEGLWLDLGGHEGSSGTLQICSLKSHALHLLDSKRGAVIVLQVHILDAGIPKPEPGCHHIVSVPPAAKTRHTQAATLLHPITHGNRRREETEKDFISETCDHFMHSFVSSHANIMTVLGQYFGVK